MNKILFTVASSLLVILTTNLFSQETLSGYDIFEKSQKCCGYY